MASRRDGGIGKLECLIQFDEVTYWLSRTRDLISGAETYSYSAFQESFWELRREARKSEFALVVVLELHTISRDLGKFCRQLRAD